MSKYKKPSDLEIQQQIDWLITNKEFISPIGGFGSDNWASIDAMVEVLENDMSEDEILEKSCEEYENKDEMGVEWSGHQRMHALQARGWLDGHEKSPESDWKILVKKDIGY